MYEKPEISIIIPIYNSEFYLEETFDCLLKQTFKSFEVILIDDGSTDSSREICQRYVTSNYMFKYYYQDNSGASVARNNGIKRAEGRYICFMDADDLCEETWIESLYGVISNSVASVAMLSWKVIDENYNIIDVVKNKDILLSIEDVLTVFQSLGGSVWNKIFEKSLIVASDTNEKEILFDEQQKYSEDIIFCIEAICKSKKIQISSKGGYIYRNHSNSISRQNGVNQISRYENMIRGQEKMIRLIEDNLKVVLPTAHKFYCSSNFYAMLDLYMSGIRDQRMYNKYANVILEDKYAELILRIMSKIVLISPGIVFIPWTLLRKCKRKVKKIIYKMRKKNV